MSILAPFADQADALLEVVSAEGSFVVLVGV
jgi:hypothetical protein